MPFLIGSVELQLGRSDETNQADWLIVSAKYTLLDREIVEFAASFEEFHILILGRIAHQDGISISRQFLHDNLEKKMKLS